MSLCIFINFRLGHSESYSFSLELETAQAEVAEKSSQVLSSQIVRTPGVDAVLHSEFDNFDQMINNITGSGSVHTAHGIMLQEVSCDNAEKVDAPTVNRTKRRSLELEQAPELPECYVTQRKSPIVKNNITIHYMCEFIDSIMMLYFLW